VRRLCVYCGSRSGDADCFLQAAEAMAAAMLRLDVGLIYGGAQIGLMGVVADAVLAGGGEVIGVIPESLKQDEVAHQGLTSLEVVPSMHHRKARMIDLADAMVALPGGLGTLEEMFEALSWAQLRLHSKACGLLNVEGYFDSLVSFLDNAVEQGFISSEHRDLAIVDRDPDRLLTTLLRLS
jgi:uncharacterized protein (TIGR00730 family)